MSLRIKSDSDLKRMRAEKLISKSSADRIESELKALDSKSAGEALPGRRGHKGKRPQTEAEAMGIDCCVVPPVMPADILYQAMVRRWGRYDTGGEVVWELEPFAGSRYRSDIALPRYSVSVEMDGWEYHGKYLDGFKKDRAKMLLFCRNGWIPFHISNEQVKTELDDVLGAIEECLARQVRREVRLQRLPKGWSRIIEEI